MERRPIRVLSTLVANQIAAGEVVERPASVVKELAENALDAGASRVVVELEQGGIELVRVSDDGSGIPREELGLALTPHATSKVSASEDLERVSTLGFRGEALASIASVARMAIRSRTGGEPGASLLRCEGGSLREVEPAAGAVGTVVEVRTLFFNTPARRKFLRTVATEQGRCIDVVRDLAMSHPAVGFMVSADGRRVMELPAGQSPRERAVALLGKELERELLEVSADRFDDDRGVALWGLVGTPVLARATRAAQHVFVRGRAVRDRTVQHALQEAFRGLIDPSRYPTAVLLIEMSPSAVDVNVHPQKSEVRFRDSGVVHSAVLSAVREALRRADLTPTLGSAGWARGGESRSAILPGDVPQPGGAAERGPAFTTGPIPEAARFVEYVARQVPARAGAISYDAVRAAVGEADRAIEQDRSRAAGPASAADGAASPEALPVPAPKARHLQVHNSYVVTQDESGVVIIDQHALHERVMFEALLARVSERELESQPLLTPVVVESTPARTDRLESLAPLLKKLGIEADALTPRSVAVRSFPTLLFERGVDPSAFMTDLLERAESEAFDPTTEEALRDVLDMMACKAAVKAGDRLDETQLATLLELRERVERSSNCPHGRPTSVRLTIRELEKLFGRG